MKGSSKRRSKGLILSGSAQLAGALTNTSAGGAFVATRYEVDTTLCPSWDQAGKLFARWRIIKLKFEFRAIKGTTTNGNMGIVFLPDTNMTTPNTTSTALSNERSAFGHIYQNVQLVVTPKHEGWLWTRDGVASTDDRLEMPGDVVFWSENTDSAFAPGIAMMHYTVQFDDVTNSTVAPSVPNKLATAVKGDDKSSSSETGVKAATVEEKVLGHTRKSKLDVSKALSGPVAFKTTDIEDIPVEVIEIARRIHRMRQNEPPLNSNPQTSHDLE